MAKQHRYNGLYAFALVTWFFNLACFATGSFIRNWRVCCVAVFVSVMIQGILSGAFRSDGDNSCTEPKRGFDHLLSFVGIFAFIVAMAGDVSLYVAGGRPEMQDGIYCIVNHGDVVRTVSKPWFIFLSVCEYACFYCMLLVFSTFMLKRVRSLWRSRK